MMLLILLVGCSKNPSYASYSNWNVSNEEFFNAYKSEFSLLIAEIASKKILKEYNKSRKPGMMGSK